jgi:hypothetical protein
MFIKKILFAFLFSCGCILIHAQTPVNKGKIMVVPFIKEGEQYRTILDQDVLRRIAIAKVKEGFDNNGYTTVDFLAKLKAANTNATFTIENQADLKTKIISNSGCDIYVVVEVATQTDYSGSSVTTILTAYEASTANSIANKVGNSGKFITTDYSKLTQKAIEKVIEDFVFMLNEKSTTMLTQGSSLTVEITFSQNASSDMNTELGQDKLPFSDVLIEWFSKNTQNSGYHIQGTSKLKMIFDDIKMPLKDSKGVTFNSNKYALELYQFIKTLGLKPSKEVVSNTIYITIN